MLEYFAMSQLDRKVNYTLYVTSGFSGKHQKAVENIWETGGGHACEQETSMVMAVAPHAVKMEYQCFSEPVTPKVDLSHLEGVSTGLWWYAMYPENIVGAPSKATAEKGMKALEASILDVADRLKAVKADTTVPMLQKEFYDRFDKVKDGV